MTDPRDVVIECESATLADILRAFVRVNNVGIPAEYRDLREQFGNLFWSLHSRLTVTELHEAVHGKTVSEFIRLYASDTQPNPVASGETDGVRWELFRKPGEDQTA